MSMGRGKLNPALEGYLEQASFVFVCLISFLLPLIYTPFTFDVFGIPKVTLLRFASLFLILLIGLKLMLTKEIKIPTSWFFALILAFFTLLLLSALFSVHIPTSLFGLRKRYFGLFTYLPILVLTFVAWTINWQRQKLEQLFLCLVASGIFTSLVGLAQVAGATFPLNLKSAFGSSAYSTFGNPNFVGIYLDMIFILSLGLAVHFKEPKYRIPLGGSVLLIFAGILGTKSSGAIFTALLVVFLFLIFQIKGRKLMGLVILLVSIVVIFTMSWWIIKNESPRWESRKVAWQAGAKLMVKYPLQGGGLDTTRFLVSSVREAKKGVNQEIFEDAHNTFLTLGATAGLPALLLFLILFVLFFREVQSARLAYPELDSLLLAILLANVGYLLAEMVNPDDVVPLALFWLLIGVGGSLKNSLKTLNFGEFGGNVAGLTLVTVALLLAILTFYPFAAEMNLLRAEKSPRLNDALFYYEQAQKFNPYYDWYWIRITDRTIGLVEEENSYLGSLAINSAQEAIRRSPLEGDNYTILGNIYQRLGQKKSRKEYLQKAINLYKQALKKNRYQLAAIYNLAQSYNLLGQKRQALTWTEAYLALEENPEVRALKEELEKNDSKRGKFPK